MREHLNIIYINSHDTGRYVQPYGHAIPTPNIQKLAERGLLFRQAFCAAPTCSPSRATLLTGRWPHSCGMLGLVHCGFSLTDPKQHLCSTLREAGYLAVLSGHQHVAQGGHIGTLGYDKIISTDFHTGHTCAVEFLDNAPKQPFYLEVGFFETHRGYPKHDAGIKPEYCSPPSIHPDLPETREDIADFAMSARVLDEKMGEVFGAVERNGLVENTLIICTTDHGIAFPEMKCNLTTHGMGVMLIMAGPQPFSGGRVVDSMVSQIDLFPTLCDRMGLDKPDWLQGVSLMPVVYGEQAEVREELFGEVTFHGAYEPMRCVRTKRWNYVRRFDDRTRPVLVNCDGGMTKNVWLKNGWREKLVDAEQLYDLAFDPMERRNLAGKKEHKAVLDEMRKRLTRHMTETADPLLEGPIALPENATKIFDPDGLDTQDKPITAK